MGEYDHYFENKKLRISEMIANLSVEDESLLDQIVLLVRNHKNTSLVKQDLHIKPFEILYLKAMSNYTEIMLRTGKKIVLSKTLKQLTGELPGTLFLRVHKSYTVNRLCMKKLIFLPICSIIMENDVSIPVSRQRKASVRNYF